MPTFDRRAFVPDAVEYFLRQDYPDRELVVLDDGADPIEDLIPGDPRIRYFRVPVRMSIGAKRNRACELACGSVIAHWDDDDWQASHRLSAQVAALESSGAVVCGTTSPLYLDPRAPAGWRYVYQGNRSWLAGNSLCYRREVWERHRFPDVNVGEDARFVWSLHPAQIVAIDDANIQVGVIHAGNVSPKETTNRFWHPHPLRAIQQLLGDDWARYVPTMEVANSRAVLRADPALPLTRRSGSSRAKEGSNPLVEEERTIEELAVARREDLDLTEFVAFRDGMNLPRMRQWELPFVLFQARLADTMSVLDCTINPAGFEARMRQLYPHVLYRHHTPIQRGAFTPLIGAPDESFDRVICVNTLEHLLRPQREALVADMARKLKRGGLLLLTSDSYFDASWQDPAFLSSGLIRQDREEVFNGFNRVTFAEWKRLCRRHGLRPLGSNHPADPQADDTNLYLNTPPHIHGTIGGIFAKSGARVSTGNRRVMLALLTWNTKEVSLDSLKAYVREAHVLRRLGHQPFVCVADSGSTDGTSDALRALDDGLDVEHRFILNETNVGNASARNQILEYFREVEADYVLFMDGDIEIVPFSSVALLRYMESSGSRLGCVGPHSWGHSNMRQRTTPTQYCIDPSSVVRSDVVAWTQYGMFRREIFDDGIRFDENPPFQGPGWGFEDNDLMFQMAVKGYLGEYFQGLTYLHRDLRSSIRIMRGLGLDAHARIESRRRYLLEKWAAVPQIRYGPLHVVAGAVVP